MENEALQGVPVKILQDPVSPHQSQIPLSARSQTRRLSVPGEISSIYPQQSNGNPVTSFLPIGGPSIVYRKLSGFASDSSESIQEKQVFDQKVMKVLFAEVDVLFHDF